jgi:hypothetical protein
MGEIAKRGGLARNPQALAWLQNQGYFDCLGP